MMGANLVGFVIGLDGMRYFLSELVGSWQGQVFLRSFEPKEILMPNLGLRFLLAACICLFIAVQVMFEYRCVISHNPLTHRS